MTRSGSGRRAALRLLPLLLPLLVGANACRAVPATDQVACTGRAGAAPALQLELVLDAHAAAAPTLLRVATAPAPTPGAHSRLLLHGRGGTTALAGPLGGVTCRVGGTALGRLAMLDLLSDQPAELTVRQAASGRVLLHTRLAPGPGRQDLRWRAP